MSDEKWEKAADRIALRTANRISGELDRMVADLPEGRSPQAALEDVVGLLVKRQPRFMQLIFEDPDFRETYYSAVATIPGYGPTFALMNDRPRRIPRQISD